ncbi:transcription antiterminator NusB [Spiroplasma poulsonii]|uniref:Transcription antiterminator NusB n=1 Tax=Spiroplasma poulsonii TaxID=2138 RepID=A0A433EQ68_9MOLU|nr:MULTISPECIES: transcription antitermination factor NusB [Spiroplasma]MBH8622636.1 transcription antiterminator NusB [Spiroplasma sp. hyd1]MBW3058762.1 transcription antiterminator NusB [Spiroplasma poulsonii]RUP76543.1 transcription antiterminator NusB [Spiroplasma poulsonii]
MSKRQERINIINLLYRHFILKHDVLTTKQEAYDFSQVVTTNVESEQIDNILQNLPTIIALINQYLKPGWKFERLSNYHKAVLVYGVYAIHYQGLAKAIVIDESLEILKLYSEDTDFSYINSILDQI